MYKLSPSKSYWDLTSFTLLVSSIAVRWLLKGLWFQLLIQIDLHPGNILFSIVEDTCNEFPLQPGESCPVKWLDREHVHDSAPEYLITSQKNEGALDKANSLMPTVRICDLGGGKSFHHGLC